MKTIASPTAEMEGVSSEQVSYAPWWYWLVSLCMTYGVVLFTCRWVPLNLGQYAWLRCLVHYDAWHYLKIAEIGYRPWDITVAFYPLYPLLIRGLNFILFRTAQDFPQGAVIALLISAAASFGIVVCLNRLCGDLLVISARKACLWLWVLGPTAYFLAIGYTEALFLFLVLAGYLRARDEDWASAGALIALACLTRPVGVLAYGMLVMQFLFQTRRNEAIRERWEPAIGLSLPVLAILAHHLYQGIYWGDFLANVRMEQAMWHQNLIGPWQFPAALATQFQVMDDPWYRTYIVYNGLYLIGAVLVTALVVRSRQLPVELKGYTVLVVLSIVCRSSEMSIPRMLMVAFPLYMALAAWSVAGSPWRFRILLSVFVVLNIGGTVLFTLERAFF